MKKFFKKLAFTTAFAMVVTSVGPAASAFAAKAPALNAKGKYLLLGDEERGSFDFNLNNKVAGSKYTWTTSDAKVAKVASNGLVTAVGNGTATIKLSIKLPTGKTKVLSAKIVVKTNATSAKVTNLPEGAIKVGETVNLNRSYTTASGKKTTDITRFEIVGDNAADATIKASSGFFTASKPGTYKVRVVFAQSAAKYAKGEFTAVSEEVEVKVANQATVAQTDLNSLKLSFATPVESTEGLKVYSVVGTTKVAQSISATEIKGNDVNVDLFVDFNAGTTYVVEFPEVADTEFVAASAKAEDVATIAITTEKAIIGEATDVKFKLFNKDGVDITDGEGLTSRVTLSNETEKGYLDTNSNKLTLITKGETTQIKAVFHSYNYNVDGTENNTVAPAVATIIAVERDAVTVGGVKAWTLVNNATPNFDKVNQKLAAEDQNYKVYVKAEKSDETTIYSDSDSLFTFSSSNSNVLIVDEVGNLTPIKAGSATIVVKYDGKVIDALTVSIVAKRTATTLDLSATSFSLSNAPDVADSKEVTVKVKDQLEADMTLANAKIEKISGTYAAGTPALIAEGPIATPIEFNAAGVTPGTYNFKVTSNGLSKVITVLVAAPTQGQTTPSRYSLDLSTTALDTAIKAGSTTKNVDIQLFGLASNGVKLRKQAVTGSTFHVEVTNAKGEVVLNTNTAGIATYSAVTVSSASTVASPEYVKAAKGTYKVSAYETVNGVKVLRDSKVFTIDDTQATPVLTKVKAIKSDSTLALAIQEAYEVKLNGVNVSDRLYVTADDILGGTTALTVYVKSVRYNEVIENGTVLTHVINVGRTLTVGSR